MIPQTLRWLGRLFAALASIALLTGAILGPDDPETTWASIKPDIFGDRAIGAGEAILALEAPVRAEDAAVVPVTVRALLPQAPDRYIKAVTIVIDENPSPVAAAFTFGPAAATASLSTRMRVNSYTYVRAIAELNDGSLWMVKTFVKASGGCSAPALKDEDSAVAKLGQMKLLQFGAEAGAESAPLVAKGGAPAAEAQIMVRHPNHSGLQMDQVTMLYIPPRFVRHIEVRRGSDLVFRMEGGISLSENPAIRFAFRKDGAGDLSIDAEDTDNKVFGKTWPVKPMGS